MGLEQGGIGLADLPAQIDRGYSLVDQQLAMLDHHIIVAPSYFRLC